MSAFRRSLLSTQSRRAILKLTPTAIDRLRKLAGNQRLLKIGVRTRGCSGLSYHLEYVDTKGKFDEEVCQDGVKVIVDSRALLSIIGSEMDYVENELGSQFTFQNPNVKETCGCGLSFTTS